MHVIHSVTINYNPITINFYANIFRINIHDTLGCRASWRVHETSNNHYNNNGGVALFQPTFGRDPISNEVHHRIKQFLIQNSRVSPSETTTKDPDNPHLATSKRILEDSLSNLWVDYRFASAINTDSESTFRNVCKKCKIFSRANHNTDMCGYCLEAVKLKADMDRISSLYKEYSIMQIMNNALDDEDENKRF